ncbi:MAG: hypothetical protein HY701_02150, partial [Gemmatimonadetes bacterium]|nr:hypothetical protein [Gemmatimonadota bacterium]
MQRFLSAICFLSLLGDAPAQDKPPQPTKADDLPIIAPMSGPLCVWRATAKKPERIKTSIGIAPHDRIGTPAGEYALFIVERDTLVSLKGLTVAADSGLSLEQSGDRLTLRLHEGRMALEAYGVKTTVETPHARAEGEGVYYLIEVTKSKSTVTVSDGE